MRTSATAASRDRVIGVTVALLGIALVGGSVYLVAPLMLEHGWRSPRALTFFGSAGAAIVLASYALRFVLTRLRPR
jgi:hypothetical protein